MEAEIKAFIADVRTREARILRSIDSIDARITRMQGRRRAKAIDALDVAGEGDHAGVTGLGDGAVSVQVGEQIRPAKEVDAGGGGDWAHGCFRWMRSCRSDVKASKEDEEEKTMPGEFTAAGCADVGAGDGDGPVGAGRRGKHSVVTRRGREEKMSIGKRFGLTLHRICCNYYGVIASLIIGAICSFTSPIFLTDDTVSWLYYGTFAAVSFFIVSLLGFQYQDHRFMRETPDLVTRLIFIVLSSVLTNIVGNLLRTSELYYYAFSLIGLAVFCLVELAQPTCDFGILQFFVCLPLQIAIPLHGLTLHWSYIPARVMPMFCLTAQICFTAHYDRIYNIRSLKAPLLCDIV